MRRGEVSSVGRVGELELAYHRRGRHTVLLRSRSRSPWHLFPPITLDETGCAYTLLLNPSGGLVGGDRLSLRATLGKDAHVLFSTPSANRVYRSASETAEQSVDLAVGPGAILEWLPEPTIPFAGSRFRQTIHVSLQPGATALLWDAIASGRVARGERWVFTDLENEIRITTAAGEYLLDRYHVHPEKKTGAGLACDWDYVASLYLVSDTVDAEIRKRLEEKIAVILDECAGSVLAGVSKPALPGLAVKLVARSAPDLNGVLESLWGAIRGQLWGFPVPALRRY
ncbi:MAG: urease accessory protein UreD [Nitrospirae bacterium]|nr:urease accessory protein UreD [Nitrospirota bacterium]